jgi:Ca2+-binding RTX toxin-like protein
MRRVLVLCSVSILMLGILAAPAAAARPRCFGERATIVGTNGSEVIVGTPKRDVIVALGGADTVRGGKGGDLICAGTGDDTVQGGRGVELIFGGAGNDALYGNRGGFNQVVPGAGDDFVDAGPAGGDEVIYLDAPRGIDGNLESGVVSGHGTDEIVNTEWLIGSEHDDTLVGFLDDHDLLFGAGGNDSLDSNGTAPGLTDFMAGGAGDDVVTGSPGGHEVIVEWSVSQFYPVLDPFVGPLNVDLVAGTLTGHGSDTLVDIEGSEGSELADVMVGNDEFNEFVLLVGGDDTVDARGGDDIVDAGDGADDLDGGAGVDLLGNLDSSAGMTIDLATGTSSQGDTFAGFEDVWGTFHDDTITGDVGVNTLVGIDGDDVLAGLGGNDTIWGDWPDDPDQSFGEDSADGGDGTDTCVAETETNCESDPSVLLTFTPGSSRLGYRSPGG